MEETLWAAVARGGGTFAAAATLALAVMKVVGGLGQQMVEMLRGHLERTDAAAERQAAAMGRQADAMAAQAAAMHAQADAMAGQGRTLELLARRRSRYRPASAAGVHPHVCGET